MAKKDEPYIKKTIAHCSFQQLITSSMSQLENNYLTLNVNFLHIPFLLVYPINSSFYSIVKGFEFDS